ncbi:anthranilate synthase component I family protein [Candidatus Symbiobacter mobilis]|uniref:Anthranilate synthase component 1 n=1 Tax=Candidatus Symbiobacter mobilis CR TaxID=946483 RepID=U5N914_9BURK|nr:chorismate-binding protein [Candidatus Symbiobacter mobilis]AGX86684.1 anthranilate synthase component I [Candidatus Symbiobacter mobilis CR]
MTSGEEEFERLRAQGFARVPVSLHTFGDLDTPLSLYCKLTGGAANSFLLESVVGGERFGRYSFIGLPARTMLRVRGFGAQTRTEVLTDGVVVQTDTGNPLDFLAAYQSHLRVAVPPGMPRFCGGLVGYFGYDTVRHIEKKLQATCPPDDLGCPDILLLQCEELAVVDNLGGRLHLIIYVDPNEPGAYARAVERLEVLRRSLQAPVQVPQPAPGPTSPPQRDFAKADYLAAVERAKRLIEQGDFMQVQVGQRIRKPFAHAPLSLYRALRSLNPSPYMYYYHFDPGQDGGGAFHVVGSSPEILVRQERVGQGDEAREKVTIRPLAGTRPRGDTPERDKAAEEELVRDPKERAEHVMLIDLARNDIGRIARIGSVRVTDAFCVERYSHVMHIVSNVEGELCPGMSQMDVLRATFPAGTLTGAPKVHAMELIDQLEPVQRGIYGGACGYLSYSGDMDLAIAIRTGIVKGSNLYVQAAAGIVADSVAEMEWRETEAKARALLHAAEMVESGWV